MEDISSFIPEQSLSTISQWIDEYECTIIISNTRKTKLGDFRTSYKEKNYVITVNKDLNKYAFLITLTHEIAHMMVWETYQNNVKAHGKEWKEMFKKLMIGIIHVFPYDIQKCLAKHLKNPRASTTSDYMLSKTLRKHDKNPALTISDIPIGSVFSTSNGKKYIKGRKIRTRFQCKLLENKKIYLFNPLTEVQI